MPIAKSVENPCNIGEHKVNVSFSPYNYDNILFDFKSTAIKQKLGRSSATFPYVSIFLSMANMIYYIWKKRGYTFT